MTPSHLSRREFLEFTAAAGSAAALAQVAPAKLWAQSAADPAGISAPEWATRPMRWFQLAFVETDPAHYSSKFWLDYFQRIRAEGVCLSGGGCVAFYPTKVPFHHRSPWLKDRDALGELVTPCRERGMSILIRTDPHATYDDVKAAHPDWIAVDAEGKPRPHWASPNMWLTCAYGPYNFEFMTAVHKEIMTLYRPDGLFHNRWDGNGICYCVHCKQNFHSATGMDLPRTTNPADASYRAWAAWRRDRLVQLVDLWNTTIRAINPDSSCIPNNGSGAMSSVDDVAFSNRAPMLVADRQGRAGLAAPWLMGKTAKEFRSTLGDKPGIGLVGVGFEEKYRWKDSVTSNAEIRIWTLEGIANGMVPWCCKFSAVLYDERWLGEIENIFVWTEKNRHYLTARKPIARVAIVYSQQTAWNYGGPQAHAKVEDYALGWCQALVESRIPFEMVHDHLLDPEHLAKYKVLILPNIAALSTAQCDQLRAFVAAGGSIVASQETSLYDENGIRRENFAMADLFGVDWTGKYEGPMQNSYIRLEHDSDPKSDFFAGLENAPRVINGVHRLIVTPRAKFVETPFTLIPSYPDLPMEEVYPREPRTDISCLYLREASGRVAYFPFDIDRTFWEVLATDHLQMMRNTIAWALNETPAVAVEGPGLLDVTAWRNPHSITVNMVNLTNPMALKGPYRGFFPIGAQTVKLNLPDRLQATQARLLVAEKTVPIERTGNTLSINVPSVLDHEVIAIDL